MIVKRTSVPVMSQTRLITSLVMSSCPSGDGTMLLAASKVLDRLKPVIGVNTDPER